MKFLILLLFVLIVSHGNSQSHKLVRAKKLIKKERYNKALKKINKDIKKNGESDATYFLELLIESKKSTNLYRFEGLKNELLTLKQNYISNQNSYKYCKKKILCDSDINTLIEFIEKKIFENYIKKNTTIDLQGYLLSHNNIKYSVLINRKIDSILLTEINKKPTYLNYKRFLHYRPNSDFLKLTKDSLKYKEDFNISYIHKRKKFSDSSLFKIDKNEWEKAKKLNTIDNLNIYLSNVYLSKFPKTIYSDSALQKITFLKNLVLPYLGADKKYRLINTYSKEYISLETFDNIKYITENFLRIEKDAMFGVIDLQGNIIIPLKYNSITSNKQQLFIVETNGKYGILNKKGVVITQPIFETIETIDNEKLIVRQKIGNQEKYGIIDNSGNIILPIKYSKLTTSSSSSHYIAQLTDKYFLIDSTGKQIGKQYNNIYFINEDIIQTYNGASYGLMRKNGELIFEPKWKSIQQSAPNEYIVENNLKEKGIIDQFDNQLFSFKNIQSIEYLSNQNYSINISTDPKIMMNIIYNTQSKKIISGIENYINATIIDSDRYAIEKNNTDLEIYSKEWKLLKSFQNIGDNNYTRYQNLNQGACGGIVEYEPASNFQINETHIISNDISELKEIYFGDKMGLINKNNEIILPIEFEQIVQFNNGLINTVKSEDKDNYYNKKPKYLIYNSKGEKYIENAIITGINGNKILTSNYDNKNFKIIDTKEHTTKSLNLEINELKVFENFNSYSIKGAIVYQLTDSTQLKDPNILSENNTNNDKYFQYNSEKEELKIENKKVIENSIFYDLDKDSLFSFLDLFKDEDAEFLGGPKAMQQWLSNNLQYPQSSIELGEQGKVYVSFVVEPDGSISNVDVERGVSDDLDREAKRVVRSMPRWIPGKNNGVAVRARCRLPIAFNLQ